MANNRHERRKAKVVELKMVPLSELQHVVCAWDGCTASFRDNMPPGWASLLMFSTPRPVAHLADIPGRDWLRDAFLCPEHAEALQRPLKMLSKLGTSDPAGHA